MSVSIVTIPTTKTTISVNENDDPQQRVKITFDNCEALYFKIETNVYQQHQLVLDIETTDDVLVDDILLPKQREIETMCGHETCDECDHQLGPETFDVFSVISVEQYKQLAIVYIELRDWSNDRIPEVGKELEAWYAWRMGSGGSGITLRPGQVVEAIEVITLGS